MRTLLLVLTLLGSGAAWAAEPATTAPPPTAPAPAAAPDQAAPAPSPPAPAPAPAALEAGDTAPPGVVQPLTPGITTAPAQTWTVPPPAPRPRPFYRRSWFWAVVGTAVVVGTIVLVLSLQTNEPDVPNTRLGDMRAFLR